MYPIYEEFIFEIDGNTCKLVIESESDVDPDFFEENYDEHIERHYVNLYIQRLNDVGDDWDDDESLTVNILNTTLIDYNTEDFSALDFVYDDYKYLFKNLKSVIDKK